MALRFNAYCVFWGFPFRSQHMETALMHWNLSGVQVGLNIENEKTNKQEKPGENTIK